MARKTWIAKRPMFGLNSTGKIKVNEMISDAILLYSYMGTLHNCHQKGFIQQLMRADAKSHSQTLGGAQEAM